MTATDSTTPAVEIEERVARERSLGTVLGQCDCCGARDVELSFGISYGIDTWACDACRNPGG